MNNQLIGIGTPEYLGFADLLLSTTFWKMMCMIWIPSLIIIGFLVFLIKKLSIRE